MPALIEDSLNDYRKFLGFVSEEEVAKLAKKYLEVPWLHTPWFTNYLASNLIASFISEGEHKSRVGEHVMKKLLPTFWNRFTSAVVSVVVFLALLGLCGYLFAQHLAVLGWLVPAFMLCYYVGHFYLDLKRAFIRQR